MVREAHVQHVRPPRRRVRHAGGLIGAGTALLLEDIVLRRLLEWHTLTQPAPPPWVPGLVQLASLGLLLAGVAHLYVARVRLVEPAAGRVLLASALLGAGALVLAEGVVMHHLLGLHDVRAGPDALAWNVAYLAVALLLLAAGARLLALAHRLRETGDARRHARGAGRMG